MKIADDDIYSVVMNEIRTDPKSISGIHRVLKERGSKLHKLVLTGYLMALAQTGQIKAKDIPPSRVYYAQGSKQSDIYDAITRHLDERNLTPAKRSAAAAYCLQRLFRRPVLLTELQMVKADHQLAKLKQVSEPRPDIRKLARRMRFKVPGNDPIYECTEECPEEYERLVAGLLIETLGARSLVLEGRQVSLESIKKEG